MASRKRTKKTPYDPSTSSRKSSRKSNSVNENDNQPSSSDNQPSTSVVNTTKNNTSVNTQINDSSLSSNVGVDLNTENRSDDIPSLFQFQSLTNTVKELTDIVKSLQSNISNLTSSNVVNVTPDKVVDVSNQSTNGQVGSNIRNVASTSHGNSDSIGIDGNAIQIEPLVLNGHDIPVGLNNQVNQVINEHVSNLMEQDNMSQLPGNYASPDRPVDFKISDKLKQQIWNNQFIDLFSLLDPKNELNAATGYDLVTDKKNDTFQLTPHKPIRKIQGLGQWCSAFQIYLTILCQKFPNQLPHLMTYMSTIKTLAHRNGDYLKYDEEFRYMRTSMNLPWNTTHAGLWLECRDAPKKQNGNKSSGKNYPNQKFNPSNKKTVHPTGYCFRYHNFGKCGRESCGFLHSCYNGLCHNAIHPVFKCPNKDKLSATQNGVASKNPTQNNQK